MLIAVLGGAGLGLIWGWLIGGLVGQARPSPQTMLVLIVATLILTFEVLLLAGWLVLVLILSMTVLSFGLHLTWRHWLRIHFESLI